MDSVTHVHGLVVYVNARPFDYDAVMMFFLTYMTLTFEFFITSLNVFFYFV